MKVSNPTRATVLRCDKCGDVFSTALARRTTCVQCKGVTPAELKTLMGFEGARVVAVSRNSETLIR